MTDVEIFADRDALVRAEAERIVALADAAIAARGRFSLALSGGSTPRPLYALLATSPFASRIDWPRVYVFWGDERCVPPDHPDSNYGMARTALLAQVPIPATNVYRIAGEQIPEDASRAYERDLRRYFAVEAGPPERSFDLVLLGMGDDGHTASLFPGTQPVTEQRRWVMPNAIGGHPRITLTPVVLNAAGTITFLVAGASKAGRLHEVIDGARRGPRLPVQEICPSHGALNWLVDVAAAQQLDRPT